MAGRVGGRAGSASGGLDARQRMCYAVGSCLSSWAWALGMLQGRLLEARKGLGGLDALLGVPCLRAGSLINALPPPANGALVAAAPPPAGCPTEEKAQS